MNHQSMIGDAVKIMVTGGAGFIGSHVADAYTAQGHEVVIVDDLSTGDRENIPAGAAFYQTDICSPEIGGIFAAEKPDIVNHHAAQISVTRSVAQPEEDARTNITGTLNLIRNCGKYGVGKMVYASSGGAVYGEPEYLPCDESHPVTPLSPYGLSKYVAEQYLTLASRLYGLDFTILRYANVYGPRQKATGEAAVVPLFITQMLRGDPVTIYGDGMQERDFMYVGDVAAANLSALTAGSRGTYNLGTGKGVNINELFNLVAGIAGYEKPLRRAPAREGEVYRSYLENRLVTRDLGWTVTVRLEDGLRNTVAFFRGD